MWEEAAHVRFFPQASFAATPRFVPPLLRWFGAIRITAG
jgi:hypothetical protein